MSHTFTRLTRFIANYRYFRGKGLTSKAAWNLAGMTSIINKVSPPARYAEAHGATGITTRRTRIESESAAQPEAVKRSRAGIARNL